MLFGNNWQELQTNQPADKDFDVQSELCHEREAAYTRERSYHTGL